MTIKVETGIGIYGANSYVPAQYVTDYLTARGRETENEWSSASQEEQEEACIEATDYIEKNFGSRFRGTPLTSFETTYAEATVSFLGLPLTGETLTVGDDVYTFVSALTGEPYEVLIGADAAATSANFVDALMGVVLQAGVTHGAATPASRHSTATSAAGVATLTATAPGASGAYTELSGSLTNVTITAFTGGTDGGSQPLSFPRTGIYDLRGNRILGVPEKIKQATAEYAVRAHAALLMQDSAADASGGPILLRREKVGPIEEEYEYGGSVSIQRYPAADRLIRAFTVAGAGGGVIRA